MPETVYSLLDFLQSPEERVAPPNTKSSHQSEMFRISLLYACRPGHPLVKLAGQIPWEWFEGRFGELYCPDYGFPGLPIRMMAALATNALKKSDLNRYVLRQRWSASARARHTSATNLV